MAPIRSMPGFAERLYVILNFGPKDEVIPRICSIVSEMIDEAILVEVANQRRLAKNRLKRAMRKAKK